MRIHGGFGGVVLACAASGPVSASAMASGVEQFGPGELISAALESPRGLALGDIDNDGDPDVIVSSLQDGRITWYENGGDADGWATHDVTSDSGSPVTIAAADFDGDGDIDIVAGDLQSNDISWYENLGAGVFDDRPSVIGTGIVDPSRVIAADLDGDGDIDVAVAARAALQGGEVLWIENLGGGVFASPLVIDDGSIVDARGLDAADVDDDGDLDLIACYLNGETIAWFENLGGGFDSEPIVICSNCGLVSDVVAADVNGDLQPDVAATIRSTGEVIWFENLGGGFSGAQTAPGGPGTPVRLIAADVQLDGDADLLTAWQLPGAICWHQNTGPGFTVAPVLIDAVVERPAALVAGDLDRDGDLDVVVADRNAGVVELWRDLTPRDRLWTSPGDGLWTDGMNWSPASGPDLRNSARFSGPGPRAVTLDEAVETRALRVEGGASDLTVDDLLRITGDVDEDEPGLTVRGVPSAELTFRDGVVMLETGGVIGGVMNQVGVLRLDDEAELVTGPLDVGAPGRGEVATTAGTIITGGPIRLHPRGRLTGAGAVDAVINGGTIDLGQTAGRTIEVLTPPASGAFGSVRVGVAGEENFGALQGGTLEVQGGLFVELMNDFLPDVGVTFPIITASSSLTGEFAAARFSGFPDNRFLFVSNEDADAGAGAIVVEVSTLGGDLEFESPSSHFVQGVPVEAAFADFDQSGTIDIALAVPAAAAGAPGSVIVLLNAGTNEEGQWLGFFETFQFAVGVNPTALDVGFFDDDLLPDLVVTAADDATVWVLNNLGLEIGPGVWGGLDVLAVVPVGAAPVDVIALDFTEDGRSDFVVTARDANLVQAVAASDAAGPGGLIFAVVQQIAVDGPILIDPIDIDDDRCTDLAVGLATATFVTIIPQIGGGLGPDIFGAPVFYESAGSPSDLVVADLDLSGGPDLIVVNELDDSISLFVNNGGAFGLRSDFEAGLTPTSAVAVNLDEDDDADIALVAVNPETQQREITVIRNDLINGTVNLTQTDTLGSDLEPLFVASADLDDDGVEDLVSVTEEFAELSGLALDGACTPSAGSCFSPNGTPGCSQFECCINVCAIEPFCCDVEWDQNCVDLANQNCVFPDSTAVTSFVSTPVTYPPGDLDLDGYVDGSDLAILLAAWGPCPGFCPPDFNDDDVVDGEDLAQLLSLWTGPPAS